MVSEDHPASLRNFDPPHGGPAEMLLVRGFHHGFAYGKGFLSRYSYAYP